MILFSLALFSSSVSASNLQLMPYPKEIKMGDGKFMLDEKFTLSVKNSDRKILAAATRFIRKLDSRTGLFWLKILSQRPMIF